MNTKKQDTNKKNDRSNSQASTSNQQGRADKKQDVDSQRHPEEQNVDAKEYLRKDKKDLSGSPKDQRI